VNDNESGLIDDIDQWLDQLAPFREDYQHHETGEDNGDSHLKALLIHHEVIVPITAGKFDWDPDKSPTGPVSVIVSSADKTVYVYRNGMEIGRAGIPNPQVTLPLNDLVFSALQGTDADGHLQWAEVTSTGESKSSENIFLASQKSGLPAAFLDKAKAVITPGTTLMFTDRPVDPTTQSPPNFQILVAQKDKPSGETE